MFNFNLTDAQGNPISMNLTYGKMETIAFPEGAFFHERLNGEIAVVHSGKTFGKRYALMNSSGKLLTNLSLKKNEYLSVNDTVLAIQNPNGKGYVLIDKDGNSLGDAAYKSIEPLSPTRMAASLIGDPKKYAMLDNSGKALTGFDYKKIDKISGDIYFAYADGGQVSALLEDGSVKFSLQCSEIRPYSNGYAVFSQGDLFGAIDQNGKIAVKPRFNWLSDCEFGLFRYCYEKQATNISPMGVVNVNGEMVIGTDIDIEILDIKDAIVLQDIEIVNETVIKHHRTYVWRENNGNQTTTYRIKLTGFVINGRIIPAKYCHLGTFSEDLRAFVSLELDDPKSVLLSGGTLNVGYEDMNFKTIISLATIRGVGNFEFEHIVQNNVFQKNFDDILYPFEDETAVVKVKNISKEVKVGFLGAFLGEQNVDMHCEARLIDKTGAEINNPALLSKRISEIQNKNRNNEPILSEAEALEKEVCLKLSALGYVPKRTLTRTSCEMLVPFMWAVNDSAGNQKIVASALETKTGFSCGLIQFAKRNLYGFADTNAEIIVDPIYDKALAFENNVSFARKDKQWYILKRSCKLEPVSELVPTDEEKMI